MGCRTDITPSGGAHVGETVYLGITWEAEPAEVTIRVRKLGSATTATEVYNGGAGNVEKPAAMKYELPYVPTVRGTYYVDFVAADGSGHDEIQSATFEVC